MEKYCQVSLSRQGFPKSPNKELKKGKMNSYGKTWHVWATDRGDRLPLGVLMLAWSFNRDGEAQPGLWRSGTRRCPSTVRKSGRSGRTCLARPQSGVDDLKGKFSRPAQAIPGVVDKNASPATTGTMSAPDPTGKAAR